MLSLQLWLSPGAVTVDVAVLGQRRVDMLLTGADAHEAENERAGLVCAWGKQV